MRREVFQGIHYPDTQDEIIGIRKIIAESGALTGRPLDNQEIILLETGPVLQVEQWPEYTNDFRYLHNSPFANRYELLVPGRGVAINPDGEFELFYQLTQTQYLERSYMKRTGVVCALVHDAIEGGLLVYSPQGVFREIRGDAGYDFVVKDIEGWRYRVVLTDWMRMLEELKNV